MGIAKTVEIMFVLLPGDEEAAHQFGPGLWGVFSEVERFFTAAAGDDGWLDVPVGRSHTHALVRPVFSRRYLGPPGPPLHPAPAGPVIPVERLDPLWREAGAASPDRPEQYTHKVLGQGVGDLLDTAATLVVVTDRQIVPPAGFRYIIWDVFSRGAVVSVAPLDPAYWAGAEAGLAGIPDAISMLEQRTRAACFSIVGSLLGLSRCRNESCYLYANVDSVSRLDEMTGFGPEHEVDALVGAR